MSFPIDTTIPNEPNDPIDDVPLMRGNFNNINSYLKVDHFEAGGAGEGYHKEVTFFEKVAQGVPVDPASVLYTDSGSASTVADMRFKNANGIFPPNAIRALGVFIADASLLPPQTITLINGFNVVSVVRTASTNYTVTFTAGAINNAVKPIVFVVENQNSQSGIADVLSNTYASDTLKFRATSGRIVNFIVLQI
jgi:hypothetical protein